MGFTGFPPAVIDFFAGLEMDNSRTYWQANKNVYDRAARAPMEELAASLEAEFGAAHIYRPYRDVRFSADKRPYKENAAMSIYDGAAGFYLSVGADGLLLGGGMWHPARDQLQRWREAVDDAGVAVGLQKLLARLEEAGYPLQSEEMLKTAPRGYARDHPRVDLLRRTSLTMGRQYEASPWLHETGCLDVVREGFRVLRLWNNWLGEHVGVSQEE